MKATFPLGHWLGVIVGAHWSVGVTTVLIADLLAVWLLPETAPGYPAGGYWTVGVATAVLFVLCLLAHELSHAVVARRQGVPVRRITLWALGGATELDGAAASPGADFRIAAVGPLTSFVVAVLFAAAGALGLLVGAPRLVLAALLWLTVTNAVLAVFNAVPGAPLDGGRILRAALWRRYGDLDRAGETSARVGQVVGMAVVVGGIAEVIALNNIVGGVWLALVGWFLTGAAAVEGASFRMRGRLARVRIGDVLRADPVRAPSWWTVDAFLDRIARQHPVRVFPVVDFLGVPIGLLSLTDLAKVPVEDRMSTRVADACRPLADQLTVRPGDSLADVAARVRLRPGEDLIVVLDGGALAGVIGAEDLSRAVQLAGLGESPRTGDPATPPPATGDPR